MNDDKDKKRDDPTKYQRRDEPDDTEKRSRYCKHGNVWGRCPQGC